MLALPIFFGLTAVRPASLAGKLQLQKAAGGFTNEGSWQSKVV
jgi:hypothetical protein